METQPLTPETTITLVNACAVDIPLYSQEFFPNTVRQDSPEFHNDIWSLLNNPAERYTALCIFRDGAKTTLVRLFLSHRVVYGLSFTIQVVSASLAHSEKTLHWIRQQVETNTKWTTFYQIEPGYKWTDSWLVIHNKVTGANISIIAAGITGQVRGVNIDDYRPDLIVVDDPDDEDTSSTPEQRKKAKERFFGAVKDSLAPETENPEAKMVLLQTPLAKDDIIDTCKQSTLWTTLTFGVFDKDGESRWPARYPTESLMKEKEEAIHLNQLYLWLREKECVISSPETNDFVPEWLKFWEVVPERMAIVLSIDPAPPPSDKQIAQGFARKDYEVLSIVGWFNDQNYLLEIARSRGHEPDWTVSEFFRLIDKWKPYKVIISAINYEKTLKWILDREMKKRKRWIQIDTVDDKRSKRHRIMQSTATVAANGNLYVHKTHLDYIAQFQSYPNVQHDDDLDAVSLGLEEFQTYPPDDFLDIYNESSSELPSSFLSAP